MNEPTWRAHSQLDVLFALVVQRGADKAEGKRAAVLISGRHSYGSQPHQVQTVRVLKNHICFYAFLRPFFPPVNQYGRMS